MGDGVILFILWTGELADLTAGFLRERSGFDVGKIRFMYAKVKTFQIILLFLNFLPNSDFCGICSSAKISL